MSKAARRNVRRAVALAAELNLHSVALYGAVWTLHHQKQQKQPLPISSKGCQSISTSRRAERSAVRLQDFQKARRFRIGTIFKRWAQSTRPKPPPQALRPPSISSLPQPSPMPSTMVQQQQPTQQQPPEQMDDERAPKRAPSTPSTADSPAIQPRAKRTLLLPPGLPPPSSTSTPPPYILPSPPSSASTPSPAMTRDAAVAASSSTPAAATRAEKVTLPSSVAKRHRVPRQLMRGRRRTRPAGAAQQAATSAVRRMCYARCVSHIYLVSNVCGECMHVSPEK